MLLSIYSSGTTIESFLLAMLASLVLGLVCAFTYMFRNTYSKSMIFTLSLLPLAVQTVIFLVNGNLGIGVAVAGAFSLVRFRSVPGTAKDITALFMAMAIGLATGTGLLFVAILFTLVMSLCLILITLSNFGACPYQERELKITIPESLDYDGVFDDILQSYTKNYSLTKIRTTNLGSLYELCYYVVLKDTKNTKDFIDKIRVRNGNLNIQLSRALSTKEELL